MFKELSLKKGDSTYEWQQMIVLMINTHQSCSQFFQSYWKCIYDHFRIMRYKVKGHQSIILKIRQNNQETSEKTSSLSFLPPTVFHDITIFAVEKISLTSVLPYQHEQIFAPNFAVRSKFSISSPNPFSFYHQCSYQKIFKRNVNV